MKQLPLLTAIFLLGFLLRIYRIDVVPPSLYADEASLGYNAFAISTSLRDEHGSFLPYESFPAFGDYKPIGYVYAAVPFVKLFGLTETAVRLPSVLAGAALVLIVYFLVREITVSRKAVKIGLLAALFVAVSPWSLQVSRAAFEANLATAFSGLGILFFLRVCRTSIAVNAVAAGGFLALAMYTFNSHRVFVPLAVIFLFLVFHREIMRKVKVFIVFTVVFLLLVLPLVPHLLSSDGRLRFNEVTWLNDLDLIEESNQRIAQSGSPLGNLIFNRRVFYAREFLRHYLDHFRLDFLFLKGDVNPRLASQYGGQLYFIDLILLISGAFFFLKHYHRGAGVLLGWLALSIVPAAMAKETPHALRVFQILPVPYIISAAGAIWLISLVRSSQIRWVISMIIIISYCLSLGYYLSDYHNYYPKRSASDWQYGYRELVSAVSRLEYRYDDIYITGRLGRPYIYFLFYGQYPVHRYLESRDAAKDSFGFWVVNRFGKYHFEEPFKLQPKALYARTPAEGKFGARLVETIVGLDGKPVFELYEN